MLYHALQTALKPLERNKDIFKNLFTNINISVITVSVRVIQLFFLDTDKLTAKYISFTKGYNMFHIDNKSSKAIYEQITEQMKYHVLCGNLKPGDAIPSVRKLALDLNITPGTVAKVYQELEREGIIETIRGKGTFIAEKIELKPDEGKLSMVKRDLKSAILELKMMGYSKDDVTSLVKNLYKEMEV